MEVSWFPRRVLHWHVSSANGHHSRIAVWSLNLTSQTGGIAWRIMESFSHEVYVAHVDPKNNLSVIVTGITMGILERGQVVRIFTPARSQELSNGSLRLVSSALPRRAEGL